MGGQWMQLETSLNLILWGEKKQEGGQSTFSEVSLCPMHSSTYRTLTQCLALGSPIIKRSFQKGLLGEEEPNENKGGKEGKHTMSTSGGNKLQPVG